MYSKAGLSGSIFFKQSGSNSSPPTRTRRYPSGENIVTAGPNPRHRRWPTPPLPPVAAAAATTRQPRNPPPHTPHRHLSTAVSSSASSKTLPLRTRERNSSPRPPSHRGCTTCSVTLPSPPWGRPSPHRRRRKGETSGGLPPPPRTYSSNPNSRIPDSLQGNPWLLLPAEGSDPGMPSGRSGLGWGRRLQGLANRRIHHLLPVMRGMHLVWY